MKTFFLQKRSLSVLGVYVCTTHICIYVCSNETLSYISPSSWTAWKWKRKHIQGNEAISLHSQIHYLNNNATLIINNSVTHKVATCLYFFSSLTQRSDRWSRTAPNSETLVKLKLSSAVGVLLYFWQLNRFSAFQWTLFSPS